MNRSQNYFSRLLLNNVVFFVVSLSSILLMGNTLSDDQVWYVSMADQMISKQYAWELWAPRYSFAYILSLLSQITANHVYSLKLLSLVCLMFYLNSANWCFKHIFRGRIISICLAFISVMPAFTLGMTFWGFLGIGYILPRMLIMPFVPLVLGLIIFNVNSRKVMYAFLLAAFGSLLNFESVLLLGLSCCYWFVRNLIAKNTKSLFDVWIWISIVIAAYITLAIFSLDQYLFLNSSESINQSYNVIIQALNTHVASLNQAEYIRVYWEAAYEGCWWAMFPPRLSDLAFIIGNQLPTLVASLIGFMLIRKENPKLLFNLIIFTLCVIFLAYGNQIYRYLGWKLWGWEPRIYEEIRTFKFFQLVIFIFSGFTLKHLWNLKKRGLFILLFLILCAPPLSLAKSLPLSIKGVVKSVGNRVSPNASAQAYIDKALGLVHSKKAEEVVELNQVLSNQLPLSDSILTLNHRIRLSGHPLVMPYIDKRLDPFEVNGVRYNRLIYWYLAYSEIKAAFDTCDISQSIHLANKYHTKYIVSECKFNNPKLLSIQQGQYLNLYELKSQSNS